MVLGMYKNPFEHFPWIEQTESRGVATPNNWYFWFYLHKKGNFEPFYLGNELTFWKIKKSVFWVGSTECIKIRSNIFHE